MMDSTLADEMGLVGPIVPVTYRWTNGISHKDEESTVISFLISGPSQQAKWFQLNNVRTIQNMNLPRVNFDLEKIKKDGKVQALRRLQIMERKMDGDPKFAEMYCKKINDYLQKGVASGNKFRLVMDAKAKSNGFSLNDLLLKGPDFVPPLTAVLMRGRKKKVAFLADITEMFHQVQIREEDQHSQRFFWRGMNRTDPPEMYTMTAMIFGAVSSPSIAQYIKNFNAKELEERLPGVQRAIVEQHYVDDYFDSADTDEEAIELIDRVITAHDHGGFKLGKFVSNSDSVIQSLDPELKANVDKPDDVKVLGLRWNVATDEIVFPLDFPKLGDILRSTDMIPTKRELLKFMMGIFDPLGVLSPVTIHLKILFQDLWRLQINWDDEIPDGFIPKWAEWLEETAKLRDVRIPRYYFPELPSFNNVELHAFCDASDKAFACVIFMVHRNPNKSYVTQVCAKSRVAPLKSQTVPRLELQGCVLASQVMKMVQEEMKVEVTSIHFWTDSKICLGWLSTTEKLTAYVGSRVSKIKENGHHTAMWHWIPSYLNVADLGTKCSKFANIAEWLKGPEFLAQERKCWPAHDVVDLTSEESNNFHDELVCIRDEGLCYQIAETIDLQLPDIKRFSDYNRLIRATAYYLKMKKILALPKKEKPETFKIDVHDMINAKNAWYKKVQMECFAEERRCLETKGFVKKSSRLFSLSPFISDGIIRMQGRIQDDGHPFGMNNPVILPDNHDFTNLLIRMYHIANCHQGVDTVVGNLRLRYRILKIRSQVKKYPHVCVTCRELRAKPTVPQMGDLPKIRTTPFVYPFTHTGIDYFGPLTIKVGRRLEKRWIVLFTCMTSRAVHLEIVPSLDTNSCIMAIRCFMAIRGVPQKINTDNGTNFTGADQELKRLTKELDHQQIEETLSVRGVEWSFIPPGAPHFGGCWERLVRSVKSALGTMLKERHPTDLVLRTVLCEVMNTINNRPLIPISDNPQDPEPLTPNMLLLGRNNFMQYDHDFEERDLDCRAAPVTKIILLIPKSVAAPEDVRN
ncbi:uncharacterized protein LOC131695375 [Topomyia yanbarensis]|uniref:uncharacterized protein LOC131695375 n=1 Tax=Topomyia yanbarensis TaxID=2498891 RepID=UPI00273C4A10|nr:uncharacterized protein LOC131695375 [Topomyia yanbarensis]